MLLQSGNPVFIYEPTGYGSCATTERPSLRQLCLDAQSAFDYAVEKFPDTAGIVLYGESFGGAIMGWLMSRRKPSAIIVKSTFLSLEHVCKELSKLIRVFPRFLFPKDPHLDLARDLSASTVPSLIIHGEGDRMVKKEHAMALHQCAGANSTLLWLPNARHAFMTPADETLLADGVARFIQSLPCLEKHDTASIAAGE
jgi:alpha-beta hydrolase superfamily lysophospholipase